MGLSKHTRMLAGLILLMGGIYGDQASVASTTLAVPEKYAGNGLAEANMYASFNELWSFGYSHFLKSTPRQSVVPETGFVNTSFSAASLNLRQAGEVSKPTQAQTLVADMAMLEAVKLRISETLAFFQSVTLSIVLQCQCGLERLFGNLTWLSLISSFFKQLKASVNIPLSSWVWFSLGAVISYLGLTRPKSALTTL